MNKNCLHCGCVYTSEKKNCPLCQREEFGFTDADEHVLIPKPWNFLFFNPAMTAAVVLLLYQVSFCALRSGFRSLCIIEILYFLLGIIIWKERSNDGTPLKIKVKIVEDYVQEKRGTCSQIRRVKPPTAFNAFAYCGILCSHLGIILSEISCHEYVWIFFLAALVLWYFACRRMLERKAVYAEIIEHFQKYHKEAVKDIISVTRNL